MNMKRILSLLLFALMCMPLSAQHFDPEHRHAIEVSSGFPPIHTFLLSGGNSFHLMNAGIRDIDHLRIGINIGYTYTINEKWDFNFVFDLAQRYYTREYYPEFDAVQITDDRSRYDFKAEPKAVKGGVDLWPSYMADFRWKWYRSDSVRLYTSFGLSYLPMRWPIFPNLTPIGINFGGNHWYGVAEMNFSTAATFLLVGAGYRF